ncbi:hypothetical protein GCM10008910_11540 [Faecalicatena orotica]|uniref:Uncharacterized protein n=1 Tax=Faecalicatena orotica TaxID=1544 RepID=A0A2Y9C9M9_9FIRM|nr:hypothetical protein [Faecalicatena orotica]PWJ31201.1 hypothetical protein A8806_10257 [Faecalicatena orotica]SSA54407.1 hypothetical protein SAMN05216536_10257 [Faecalicatena orotica]
MEYLVLNSYINLEKNKHNWKTILKKIPRPKIVCFLIMLISACCTVAFALQGEVLLEFISFAIEIIFAVIMTVIIQKECVINSNRDIKKQNDRYDEIKEWLKSIGFEEKNQIKQLCRRCEVEIESHKEKESKREKFLDKLFDFFLIPIFVAVISWIFNMEGSMSEQIEIVTKVGIIGIVLYVLLYVALDFFSPFIDKKYIKMYEMIKDIQGVLDRKFIIENEDIV